MPSLNQIKDFIADRLDRPNDDMLKAEIRFAFINEISLLLRRTIDANGVDASFIASFTVGVKSVTDTDDITIAGTSNIIRSINRIPLPIRYKTPVPFIFVGSVDNKTVFGYVIGYAASFTTDLPYINDSITYDFVNQYLYLYNIESLSNVRIIAPYADFTLITDNTTDSKGITYDDSMELPYPEDLINAVILSLLQGVFGNLDSKDKVEATHLDNQ